MSRALDLVATESVSLVTSPRSEPLTHSLHRANVRRLVLVAHGCASDAGSNPSLLAQRNRKRALDQDGEISTVEGASQSGRERQRQLAAGREIQRDVSGPMERLRHRNRMQTASPPPPRMLIGYAKSLLRAPPIARRVVGQISTCTSSFARIANPTPKCNCRGYSPSRKKLNDHSRHSRSGEAGEGGRR